MTGAVDAPAWVMAKLSDAELDELWAQARAKGLLVTIEEGSFTGRFIAKVDGLNVHARGESAVSPYDAAQAALGRVA